MGEREDFANKKENKTKTKKIENVDSKIYASSELVPKHSSRPYKRLKVHQACFEKHLHLTIFNFIK